MPLCCALDHVPEDEDSLILIVYEITLSDKNYYYTHSGLMHNL